MFLDCVCETPSVPSVDEILDALRRMTECTDTECHQPLLLHTPTDDTAVTTTFAPLALTGWWMFLALSYLWTRRRRPRSDNAHKPVAAAAQPPRVG